MKTINPIAIPQLQPKADLSPTEKASKNFADILKNTVGDVNNLEQAADTAVEKLHTGEGKNLHEVMIAMEQADISLRYMVSVRNKMLEAYQEIMRLQI